jgi:hypothetical protein
MDDRMAAGAVHGRHDAILKSRIACDADVAQDRACKPGKKPSTWFSQGPHPQGFCRPRARAQKDGSWRGASHMRAHSTQLGGSVRDHVIGASLASAASPTGKLSTRPHAVMTFDPIPRIKAQSPKQRGRTEQAINSFTETMNWPRGRSSTRPRARRLNTMQRCPLRDTESVVDPHVTPSPSESER